MNSQKVFRLASILLKYARTNDGQLEEDMVFFIQKIKQLASKLNLSDKNKNMLEGMLERYHTSGKIEKIEDILRQLENAYMQKERVTPNRRVKKPLKNF